MFVCSLLFGEYCLRFVTTNIDCEICIGMF